MGKKAETNDPPELAKLLTKKISSKFGRTAGYAFAIALLAIPVVWSSIGPTYELFEKAWTNWRLNHPSTPEISPGRFVVGIYVRAANKADDAIFSQLQIRFHRHPSIEIIKIALPQGAAEESAFDEKQIQKWIEKTGAAGALWGRISGDSSGNVALLSWSRPRFNDFVEWDANDWIFEPTIAFGALPRDQVGDLAGVWLKSQAKLFFQTRRLSRIQENGLELEKVERSAFKQIIANACNKKAGSKGTSCFLLARAQIELFLNAPPNC